MSLVLDVDNWWESSVDQISLPKKKSVISTVGTKLNTFHLAVVGKTKLNWPLLKTLYIRKQLFSAVLKIDSEKSPKTSLVEWFLNQKDPQPKCFPRDLWVILNMVTVFLSCHIRVLTDCSFTS